MGVSGQWASGLHGSSNRSVIFSRALHTPQPLFLTLFLCGTVWVVGCCLEFSQIHGSSSQWEWQGFTRAASGVVQRRWELKEQRATLKHFLQPQSPSKSLQFCLRTGSAASAKSATTKITAEKGIQEFSLYYWKALRPFQCSASWEKKILAGIWFSSFTVLWSENVVPGGSLLPFGGRRCVCLLGMAAHTPCVWERITVIFSVALSAQGLSKFLTPTPLGKPGRPKFSPWFFL